MRILRLVPLVALIALIPIDDGARACSCAAPTVCEAYADADAVFVGFVTCVDPEVLDRDDVDYTPPDQKVYVRVERAFKGVEPDTEIVLDQPGGFCGWTF